MDNKQQVAMIPIHHRAVTDQSQKPGGAYWLVMAGLAVGLWLIYLPSYNHKYKQTDKVYRNERQHSPNAYSAIFASSHSTSSNTGVLHITENQPSRIRDSRLSKPMNVSLLATSTGTPVPSLPNLTFILSPGYLKKHNIPESVVREKRRKCEAYINRYGPVAVSEMHRYGIPASIKLAQGLLESDVGESALAQGNHNHFGIKCFSRTCEKGHCSNHNDDSHKDFFRIYKSPLESYRAHSEFLQHKRYRDLRRFPSDDYKSWARGLKEAGYATDPKYADKLIAIIETLELGDWDHQSVFH